MSPTLAFPVPPADDGMRLDAFLARAVPHLSRREAQALLATHNRLVPTRPLKASQRVRRGTVVHLATPERAEPAVAGDVVVRYADPHVLVVAKGPDLPIHPCGGFVNNTVVGRLQAQGLGPVYPVHRLDRETSGLVLLARTPECAAALGKAWNESAEKVYLAIVRGHPTPAAGRVALAIGRDRRSPVAVKRAVVPVAAGGQVAVTHYRVLRRLPGRALVRLRLDTGRAHQIRVHLQAIGHPVLGDKLYGPDERLYLAFVAGRLSPADMERLGHERQALHAAALTVRHPVSGQRLRFREPLPPDLRHLLRGPP